VKKGKKIIIMIVDGAMMVTEKSSRRHSGVGIHYTVFLCNMLHAYMANGNTSIQGRNYGEILGIDPPP